MALRNAFLETSYLPFASLLLREVGPTWLPVWDSNITPAPVPAPRDLFEAFFRPPALPSSLALLGLCEGLSRQAPESTTANTRLALAQQSESDRSVGGEAGMVVGSTPAPDARGVQHICRLLEPYLRGPSTRQAQITPTDSSKVPLLVSAVRELAGGGVDDNGSNSGVILKEGEAGDGRQDDSSDIDHTPSPCLGGDAAEALASALCLAPQRVANSLGPIAPPDFSPSEFFPAVCRAVVSAVLAGLTAKMRATATAVATTAAKPTAVVDDVWREFTGRLLTAGRASDLADAWLGAILATESQRKVGDNTERNEPVGMNGAAAAGESDTAAWEAWAEDSRDLPEVHAWMMKMLPESMRKPLTEALLRALWPRGRHLARRGQQGTKLQPSRWPPGFPAAVCRVLIGRPLLPDRRLRMQRREGDGQHHAGEAEGGTGSGNETASVFPQGRGNQSRDSNYDGGEAAEAAIDASVGLVERLLLQRPLPTPAAEAIADTLAWCDRRLAGTALRFGAAGGKGGDSDARAGGRRRLLISTLKRVAAVWAEPSFLNRSPLRQQEFYTSFLLAALRRYVRDAFFCISRV